LTGETNVRSGGDDSDRQPRPTGLPGENVPVGETVVPASEERFRTALVNSPVIVATCDTDLRYTWLFTPLSPYTSDTALGRRDDELAPAEHVADLMALKRDAIAGRERIRREVMVQVGDEVRCYDVTAEPLPGDGGAVIGVITAAADVTERKRAEDEQLRLLVSERDARQRAEQTIRARNAVLQVVSHDLRNPINTIRMAADLLAATPDIEPEPRQRRLAVIRHTVDQMERLVHGLLDLWRVDAGVEIPVTAAAVAVRPLLEEAAALFELPAQAQGIDIVVDAPATLRPMYADRVRILQVLWNLVGNALQYTRGRITLGAHAADDFICCWVRDTGPGIPAEHLPHLFDAFWQADPDAGSGRGLGLSIVRTVVEAHGGHVRVESEAGQGTTFEFVVPAVAATDQAGMPAAEAE
jgi:PAS domain S-box-containing protein